MAVDAKAWPNRFSGALPRSRSGKIIRRILRSLAAGEKVSGDSITLEDRRNLDDLDVHGRKVC